MPRVENVLSVIDNEWLVAANNATDLCQAEARLAAKLGRIKEWHELSHDRRRVGENTGSLVGRNRDLIQKVLGQFDERIFRPLSDLASQRLKVVTNAGQDLSFGIAECHEMLTLSRQPSNPRFRALALSLVRGRYDDPIGSSYLPDRKSTRLNSSHGSISYAVFCLKKKKKKTQTHIYIKCN